MDLKKRLDRLEEVVDTTAEDRDAQIRRAIRHMALLHPDVLELLEDAACAEDSGNITEAERLRALAAPRIAEWEETCTRQVDGELNDAHADGRAATVDPLRN